MIYKKFTPLEVGIVLNNIYISEINIRISNFFDEGFDYEIGDATNGFLNLDDDEELKQELQKQNLDWNKIEDVVSALSYSLAMVYPESKFTEWYKQVKRI